MYPITATRIFVNFVGRLILIFVSRYVKIYSFFCQSCAEGIFFLHFIKLVSPRCVLQVQILGCYCVFY